MNYAGRPLVTPAKIAGQPIEALLDLLKATDNRVRYRAKIEWDETAWKKRKAAPKKGGGKFAEMDHGQFAAGTIDSLWGGKGAVPVASSASWCTRFSARTPRS